MTKTLIALLCASALPLAACSTTADNETLEGAGTGAGVGAVVGAGVGAAVGGLSPIEGAAIGAAVGGLAGAVWADRDNDGRADGYTDQYGRYHEGRPAGARSCPSTLAGAAGGAGVGAVAGAGVGAVVGGVSPLEGAAVGAVVGGLAGAVWADQNNDGCVDGYRTRDGRYWQGAPPQTTTGARTGERG